MCHGKRSMIVCRIWWERCIAEQKSVTQVSMQDHLIKSIRPITVCHTHRWTLAYTVSDLLQHEVDEFVKHWNTHTIHQSCADCIGGIPDDLYDMPQNYGQLF